MASVSYCDTSWMTVTYKKNNLNQHPKDTQVSKNTTHTTTKKNYISFETIRCPNYKEINPQEKLKHIQQRITNQLLNLNK